MLKRYTPFHTLLSLDRDFNRLFNMDRSNKDFFPEMDISETENEFKIELNCAGYGKENLNLTVNNGYLTISGEKLINSASDVKYHLVERSFDKFSRSFKLPNYVNSDKVVADYIDGVLIVTFAKQESTKAKQIEINSANTEKTLTASV